MAKLMNWYQFERTLKAKKLLVFTPLDVRRIFGASRVSVTFLLHRYAKRGFLIRVKRGLYAFSDVDMPTFLLANKLYEPSYISLETGLSFHGIISETVYEVTSLTTKSTRRFESMKRVFSYRRVKKEAFGFYVPMKHSGVTFLMAESEKAFVDYMYFTLLDNAHLLDRLNTKKLDRRKIFRYAELFDNLRLIAFIKTIIQ